MELGHVYGRSVVEIEIFVVSEKGKCLMIVSLLNTNIYPKLFMPVCQMGDSPDDRQSGTHAVSSESLRGCLVNSVYIPSEDQFHPTLQSHFYLIFLLFYLTHLCSREHIFLKFS